VIIYLAISTEYRRVTDAGTDRQTDGHLATAYSALCIALRDKKGDVFFERRCIWHCYTVILPDVPQSLHQSLNPCISKTGSTQCISYDWLQQLYI